MIDNPGESATSYSLAVVAVGTALVVLFAGVGVIAAVGREVPQEMWAAASVLSGALVGILIPTPSGASPDHVADAASFTKAAATSAAHAAAATISGATAQPKTAKAAAKAVKTTAVDSLVKEVRGAGIPSGDVIDAVIGVFAKLAQDAQVKASEAQQAAEKGQQQGGPSAAALEEKLEQANATHTVQAAAAEAAERSRDAAAKIADPGSAVPGSGASRMTRQTIALLVLAGLVLVGALALALAISTGHIHPVGCSLASSSASSGSSGVEAQSCDSNLLQVGTVVLALASAAGGTLLGLFATPDGKPVVAGTASKATK